MTEEAGQPVVQRRVLRDIDLRAECLPLILAATELWPKGRSRPV
jgi:hypothetical protein